MEILYVLLILLLFTRVGGEIAERLKLPALVGELLVGVVIGVVAARFSGTFPILSDLKHDKVFHAITDLGIFFLMLLAGVELQPRRLMKASGSATIVAISGFLIPLGAGFGLGWLFLPASDWRVAQALFIGTALAVTAVPVAVKVLIDLGKLDSKPGRMIVSAAVVDDVLSLFLLAVLTSVLGSGALPGATELGLLAAKILGFFAITFLVGHYVFPRVGKLLKRAEVGEFELSFLIVAALAYSVLAEVLGMHFIIGAFMAGLFFGRQTVDEQVYKDTTDKVSGITNGFLAPVFFASIGLQVDLSAIWHAPVFLVAILVVAIGAKMAGAGLAAYGVGSGKRIAVAVGLGMTARGAVELIVADVALKAGMFEVPEPTPTIVAQLFSAIVIMAVVTTIAAPIGLRWALGRSGER